MKKLLWSISTSFGHGPPALAAVLTGPRREEHPDINSHFQSHHFKFPNVSIFSGAALEGSLCKDHAARSRSGDNAADQGAQRASVWVRGATCFRSHRLQPLPLKLLFTMPVSPSNEAVAAAEMQVPYRTAAGLGAMFGDFFFFLEGVGGGGGQSRFHRKHQLIK